MTELQLARGATKWLRTLGLAVIGLILALVISVTSFLNAQSAIDGSDSEIDYSFSLTSNVAYSNDQTLRPASQFTFEAWTRPGSMSGTGDRVFARRHYDYAIVSVNGKWSYYFGTASGWSARQDTNIAVQPNVWTHVALVMDGSNVQFYLNGQLAHSASGRTPQGVNGSNAEERATSLGSWGYWAGDFVGEIDEVKLWSSNRSTSLVGDMHNRAASSDAGLLAYWDFNNGSGSTVYGRKSSINLTTGGATNVYSDVKRISYSGGDTVITFPRTYLPGTTGWTVPTNANSFKALVVAGGGGGGGNADGGGGGAGGVVEFQTLSISSTVAIKVGQGGPGGLNTSALSNHGKSGQNSELGSVVAIGGGGGGGYGYPSNYDRAIGYSGGSGGGHAEQDSNQAAAAGTQATDATTYAGGVEYGNAGGTMIPASQAGSGGGGAGGAGGNAASYRVAGAGGAGMSSTITGTSTFYAAGGGGADRDGTGANGGSSIGGTGAGPNNTTPTEGAVNTGSGGGGAYGTAGANGGSGVVIIRYSPNKDSAWDKNNTAQSFAWTDSQVIPASGNFTYEGWYYLDATDVGEGWHALFSQMDTPQNYSQRASLWLNNGYLHGTYGGTGFSSLYAFKLVQDRWYHIAFVRNGSDAEIYVDGTKVLDEAIAWGDKLR
jgi:hypothetical protein